MILYLGSVPYIVFVILRSVPVMITCLIVEDEHLAASLLEKYLVQFAPQLRLVGKCDSAAQAIDVLQKQTIDLLWLDIRLPDLSGIELLRSLPYKPAVVLTTAYSDYAIEGYQLNVIDYLLKPIALERFLQAVNKVCAYVDLRKKASTHQNTPTNPPDSPLKDYMFVKADHKMIKVRFDDILYIQGLREYVCIYTTTDKLVILEAMKNLEVTLPQDRFLRVHKSYIVATEKVAALAGNEIEIGKISIPIGKIYRDKVMEVFR